MTDQVALVTGGASGIGAAVARRLRTRGASVVIADLDPAGEQVADELDGAFVHCDVSDLEENRRAVAAAVERFGGIDVAVLNAGVSSGMGVDEDFDAERYRRIMGVNLDGVAFGVVAALPALRERGGGDIVATASLAGLTAVPLDPFYTANKHAVVGLVRSLGWLAERDGVRVNALCPGFTDTPLIEGVREFLAGAGMPILPADEVIDAFEALLDARGAGECWFVQRGRRSEPFQFRNMPGPRPAEAP